jgi:ribonucleoside-diphosphate reductase alpha chain
MSLNFSYNPEHYPDGRVPLAVMMNHTALLAKYGLKTRYYVNTKGEDKDKVEKMTAAAEQTAALSAEEEAGCESGACAI